ncbi:MAG TPA: prepilin-type N-terminal cleavage/methylation domain-containing protein [Geomonas sp.]|nr:prepilin-type N-terminal cleavage/methylation domain-containing protein [Geomonas sp.]
MNKLDERGFTLLELVVVIGIMAVILSIATMAFNTMNRNRRIEAQVRQMQAEFDNVRLSAMTTKKNYAVLLNPTSYAFLSYSSEGDPGTPAGQTQQVQFPIQQFSSGSYRDFNATLLSIDARGCLTAPAAPLYIAVAPGISGPAVNALAVQTAKTNVGLLQGGNCVLQ